MRWIDWLGIAFALYGAIGFVFALAFAWRGAASIDPQARGASLGFRLIILPGAAALWPLLLTQWISGQTDVPTERNAHRQAAARPR